MNFKENDTVINERYEIVKKITNNTFECDDLQLRRRSKDYKCNNIFLKLNKNDNLVETIFLNQVNKIKDIKHKNILRVIDGEFVNKLDGENFTENNLMFIVQEHFVGEPLEKFLLSRKLNNEDRINIVNQLLDGLLYLHSQSIVHGNLDTKNIYIEKENHKLIVKISNYGLNKLNETFYDEKVLTKKKYSNYYNEIKDDIDVKNDIYALSLIITEILADYNLFLGENIDDIIVNKLNPKYQNFIKQMLYVEDETKGYVIKELKDSMISNTKSIYNYNKNKKSYALTRRISGTKLFLNNYIDYGRESLAEQFFNEELKDSYLTYAKENKNKFDESSIIICGKRIKFFCKVDEKNKNALVAVGFAKSFEEIEEIKEYALKVDWDWDTTGINPNNGNLESLLKKLKEHTDNYNNKTDIMDIWKTVLKIERDNMYESRKKVSYQSFTYDKNSYLLYVDVGDELDDNPYTGADDEVLIMSNKDKSKKDIKVGSFEDYVNGKIIIAVENDFDEKLISPSGYLQVDTSGVNSLLRRKDIALRNIENERSLNKNLKSIIKNPCNAESYDRVTSDTINFIDTKLDESKKSNVIKAINSEDIFLLQGPPGTGKTTFIKELVCQIINKQKDAKILIASQSHVAVDNALDNIANDISNIGIIRLGDNSKVSQSMKQKSLDNHTEKWINSISYNSQLAMKRFNEIFDEKNNLKEQKYIIEKLSNLYEEIKNIKIDFANKSEKYKDIKEIYKKLIEFQNEFENELNKFPQKLENELQNCSDNELLTKLNQFKDKYMNLGEIFLDKFKNINLISNKKQELKEELLYLNKIIHDKNQQIKADQLQLNIESEDDFEKTKLEIENKEKEYEKYKNIPNILEEWRFRLSKGNKELEDESIKHASIIGGTCLEMGKKAYDLEFDWVIVDEAGKATPPEIFVPITLGKKVILVGDDKQLPPVIEKELYTNDELKEKGLTKKDLEKSLFGHLTDNLPEECKGILEVQYRMNPIIGNLISEVFYKDKLKSGCKFEDKYHDLNIDEFKNKAITWLTTSKLRNKHENMLKNGNYYNECELEIIKDYLSKINDDYSKQNIKGKTVGIICGYRKQKDALINNINVNNYNNLNLDINTVDAFQGRECDIIFYSVVRSNEKGNIGFLKDIRRLNVALSRGKELLIIVGDHKCAIRNRKIENKKNPFVSVIEYIEKNGQCSINEV